MPDPATKSSWKTLEPPKTRAALGYEYVFDDVDAERLRDGLVPEAMEDKWFAYFENGWLYLHRSWTGALIYWLKLDGCPAGVRVVDSWVSREPEQYRETDVSYDRLLLDFLLRGLILRHEVAFPTRQKDAAVGPPGLYQHHLVGRGYPEEIVPDERPTGEHGA
jgi:hypothetical protein